MFQTKSFTHHGQSFVIEAEDWPAAESKAAAVIALQSWAMALGFEETTLLHRALLRETQALVHEVPYDRQDSPLQAVREAQRLAIRAGLAGQTPTGPQPTITLEAVEEA